MKAKQPKKIDLRLKCKCGDYQRIHGETDVDLEVVAKACVFYMDLLGWVENDDGSWICPACIKRED